MQKTHVPYFSQVSAIAPLAVFRIIFGILMTVGVVRFWAMGWIDKLYIQPITFFPYYGFEWVQPLGQFTYVLFLICGISAFCVAIGFKYRLSITSFFCSFLYIELMDKTTYLNHYYFITILSFLLIFLPAGNYFSFDTKRNPNHSYSFIPRWQIDAIKLLLGIVYFYAGLAKLNSDWLLSAMPLKIWLPTATDLPILHSLFQYKSVIFSFAWFGALYDLSIPFLLLYSKTRKLAFGMVVVFHAITAILFPIGLFPYIMILSALIFFDTNFHQNIINSLKKVFKFKIIESDKYLISTKGVTNQIKTFILIGFFSIQLLLPFRYLLYPGELFWTEEGYRFSWRVMLMEKAGYAQFKIENNQTGKYFLVNNQDFLTSFQEKQMATQPDFILAYAHFLKQHFSSHGHKDISIFADCFVALNGRRSTRYIDPTIDLTQEKESFKHKSWIIPFNDEITGI